MELHFSKSVCQCLRKAICQTVSQEQTQELRLPDAMPDIGRVLGSWGQIVIRSKEWRGNGMQVTGGVMAWVLYAPEGGGSPQTLDCWIPIQMKWDFPQTQRDGTICVFPAVKSMDARTVSARKIMVRAVISILGEALEPMEAELYECVQVPEDISLLKRTYPLVLPLEAGEKSIQTEEELIFPPSAPPVDRIIHYEMVPVVTEQKVLANRLVFRGNGCLRLVYLTQDGQIAGWNWELPFSQYTELDRDYGPNAIPWTMPMVTSLELDRDGEGKWRMKAGIAVQYVIQDRIMAELVQDAYSPNRKVTVHMDTLHLPMELDNCKEDLQVRPEWERPGQRILDAVWYHDHPRQHREGDVLDVEVAGQFQILYQDEEGQLQGAVVRKEDHIPVAVSADSRLDCYMCSQVVSGDLLAEGSIHCSVTGQQGLSMVTGLEVGETVQPDPHRPSLILRRANGEDLWSIAKSCGSTVDAIEKANHLTQEPMPDQMLLIPIP